MTTTLSLHRSVRSLLAAALLAAPTALLAATVGQPAPSFSAVDSNGKTYALPDLKGKTVVLEWTNDGCPFVKKHYGSGNMQALQKDATAQDVVWLSVVSSAPGAQGFADGARANELTEKRGAHPSAVLLDPQGKLGHLYGAQTTPHMFVIDKAGTLVYNGAIDSLPSSDPDDIAKATNYVNQALSQLAAGQSVTPPTTKPYGCSVKYSS